MAMIEAMLAEFDHEMTLTRKLLERVPDGSFEWKPHAKSMSLGQLAQHVATIPMWGSMTLSRTELDVGAADPLPAATTRADLLAGFDRHVTETRATLVRTADAELMTPWTLKSGGHTVFSMPKAVVWRSFVLSHLIHHRGQLSVYLRMHDVPLPSIYGPSADEGTA